MLILGEEIDPMSANVSKKYFMLQCCKTTKEEGNNKQKTPAFGNRQEGCKVGDLQTIFTKKSNYYFNTYPTKNNKIKKSHNIH